MEWRRPDATVWFTVTATICFSAIMIGWMIQGLEDGDVMTWTGYDIVGVVVALVVAIVSASLYLGISFRR